MIHQVVPTEMAIDPGTMVLGMLLDTLRGRSPLYRLEECFAHHDTARLLGQAIAPGACDDAPVGRVFTRLYDTGTMKVCTDGNAAAKTVKTLLGATLALFLAQPGAASGADRDVAAAARVTEDHLAALGDPLFLPRVPATSNAGGRIIAEAVAAHTWDDRGTIAHTKPTTPRPGTA